jgi:serine/threonine-protein kinase
MANELEQLSRALAERYRVGDEIGRGGMATVYRAHDLKHDRSVALKVLKPELAAALGTERFLREITLTARLDHPHILPLLDSGEADGLLYYVMPFVDGESLRARLDREKQLPLDDALRIARQVADALGHAHGQGIVHRDIKPENILLSGGHARVADFGIARAVTAAGGASLTETGLAVGTPAYMSPEQGSGEEVDARTDVYSLGCVVYEMLAGEPPYTGATAGAILARKAMAAVPSLRVVRETVPVAVEQA